MTDTFYLFSPAEAIIPIQELFELSGNENIKAIPNEENPHGYQVVWDDVQFNIEQLNLDQAHALLHEATQLAEDLLTGRDDNKARKNLQRVQSAVSVYQVTITPSPDAEEKAKTLLKGILAFAEGSYFIAENAFYNENAKRFLGDDNTRPKYFKDILPEDSVEATARKERSINLLQREKIPTIPHLPVIVDSTKTHPRSIEDICKRIYALVLIAEKAEGESTETYEARVKQYGLQDVVSPDEWAFAHTDKPIKQDIIKFSQRLESAWMLAWTLGYVATLVKASEFCDSDTLREWVKSTPLSTFIKQAKLTSLENILNETDFIYRIHWAVNDAELYGARIPAKLIPPVVYERHYALNWLISAPTEWDKTITDT
jgi:hypothetical protein